MQPWGGRLLRYNLGSGRDQQLGVEIDHVVAAKPAPRPAPPTAPPVPSPSGGRSGRPPSPSPSGGGSERGRTRIYVVKSGDTLSGVARAQHVTLQRLIAANPQIKNPNRIVPGQRVTIPT
jgi:LysM repeat protein